MIAGLLFLAFAYFAVGQAASTRNSAQTAADAAALAAAQDAREQLREGWLGVILDPGQWDEFLEGKAYVDAPACASAADFASRNEAELTDCESVSAESHGFRATVLTTGGEANRATASAEAVIEPLCRFEPQEPTPDPSTPPPSPPPTDEPEEEEPGSILGLTCAGEPWEIDLEDPRLPSATDLFTVRLSE